VCCRRRELQEQQRPRVLNIAKERNQPFDLVLTRYVLERLLYRLGSTKHRERFVLMGAMLLTTWLDDPLRPTRDLDLLGFGDSDPDALLGVFRQICAIDAHDAVTSMSQALGSTAFVTKRSMAVCASRATRRSMGRG
jgi:hypothetical protein